jgi:ribosomal protein L6P/L9E
VAAPEGIEFEVPSPTQVVVRASTQLVGEMARGSPLLPT